MKKLVLESRNFTGIEVNTEKNGGITTEEVEEDGFALVGRSGGRLDGAWEVEVVERRKPRRN